MGMVAAPSCHIAAAGAFRAVAALENWNLREAKPDDNEARAVTATVRPATGSTALAN